MRSALSHDRNRSGEIEFGEVLSTIELYNNPRATVSYDEVSAVIEKYNADQNRGMDPTQMVDRPASESASAGDGSDQTDKDMVHIPEDQDRDGQIDEQFRNSSPSPKSAIGGLGPSINVGGADIPVVALLIVAIGLIWGWS